MLIVLGNGSLAQYPPGGGHWSWFLQYPLGLKALGHKFLWLELLKSSDDRVRDIALIRDFFVRIGTHGLAQDCALMLVEDKEAQHLERAEIFGRSLAQVVEAVASADLLWNMSCAIREPLLSRFRHRVLIDTDPGHLQVAALSCDLGIQRHQVLLSVGTKIHDPDCEVPTLDFTWRRFWPFVHLPMFPPVPDPGSSAPFTSITQWTWEELHLNGRVLSASKRAAYLRIANLPQNAGRLFELAANIGAYDPAHDRDTLRQGGWRLVEPHEVAATPESYRDYIQRSRAEILCPKPIFRELKTGWFSDRSVCYLATGRPVLAEETGFSDRLPVGRGLLAFHDIAEAVDAVAEIDSNYALHSRTARELAEDLFDSRRCLNAMLSSSF